MHIKCSQWLIPAIPATGGRDGEDQDSRPTGAKREQDFTLTNKPGVLLYAYHPSYAGGFRQNYSLKPAPGKK
jgi:hypothetical protein